MVPTRNRSVCNLNHKYLKPIRIVFIADWFLHSTIHALPVCTLLFLQHSYIYCIRGENQARPSTIQHESQWAVAGHTPLTALTWWGRPNMVNVWAGLGWAFGWGGWWVGLILVNIFCAMDFKYTKRYGQLGGPSFLRNVSNLIIVLLLAIDHFGITSMLYFLLG